MSRALTDIAAYLDERLAIASTADFPGAWNGLQLENSGHVTRICAAVDASIQVLERASSQTGALLLVHHGMFWGEIRPLTGSTCRKLRLAVMADLAIYSAHLPLDRHPEIGNNALLLKALGLTPCGTFFPEFDLDLGLVAETDQALDDFVGVVETAVQGPVRALRCGPGHVKRVGVVTGGAGSGLHKAAAAGLDTFITGEGPHHTFSLAQDLGLNVLYAGHYATEVFGVKAAAAETAGRFGIPWVFLDSPSGL